MSYGYQSALEAAGAKIIIFKEFGSYQGEWYALISVSGRIGWANGAYGSCSGCDAFEAEFGDLSRGCDEHRWDEQDDCWECQEKKESYGIRLKEFGMVYINSMMTQEEAIKATSKYLEWDMSAQEMVDFIKANNFVQPVKLDEGLFTL